ncbi:hypothetical protein OPT61_g2303 [Boeremia exigua]|uniref:Uncharacterized protein n=1 Tax=Boeremia exigua TaxID=749465 RepID=A0ACC2IM08_9PLEO|nr:hypothetical protein OPT61_g2303 [Boeremia exigua]
MPTTSSDSWVAAPAGPPKSISSKTLDLCHHRLRYTACIASAAELQAAHPQKRPWLVSNPEGTKISSHAAYARASGTQAAKLAWSSCDQKGVLVVVERSAVLVGVLLLGWTTACHEAVYAGKRPWGAPDRFASAIDPHVRRIASGYDPMPPQSDPAPRPSQDPLYFPLLAELDTVQSSERGLQSTLEHRAHLDSSATQRHWVQGRSGLQQGCSALGVADTLARTFPSVETESATGLAGIVSHPDLLEPNLLPSRLPPATMTEHNQEYRWGCPHPQHALQPFTDDHDQQPDTLQGYIGYCSCMDGDQGHIFVDSTTGEATSVQLNSRDLVLDGVGDTGTMDDAHHFGPQPMFGPESSSYVSSMRYNTGESSDGQNVGTSFTGMTNEAIDQYEYRNPVDETAISVQGVSTPFPEYSSAYSDAAPLAHVMHDQPFDQEFGMSYPPANVEPTSVGYHSRVVSVADPGFDPRVSQQQSCVNMSDIQPICDGFWSRSHVRTGEHTSQGVLRDRQSNYHSQAHGLPLIDMEYRCDDSTLPESNPAMSQMAFNNDIDEMVGITPATSISVEGTAPIQHPREMTMDRHRQVPPDSLPSNLVVLTGGFQYSVRADTPDQTSYDQCQTQGSSSYAVGQQLDSLSVPHPELGFSRESSTVSSPSQMSVGSSRWSVASPSVPSPLPCDEPGCSQAFHDRANTAAKTLTVLNLTKDQMRDLTTTDAATRI